MWPVLKALGSLGGSATNEELLDRVIAIEALPDEVASIIHGDHRQTRLAYNLAWARSYLKQAGAVSNSGRGVWSLTELGAHLSEGDVKTLPSQVRRTNYQQRQNEEVDYSTSDAAVVSWRDELPIHLRQLSPASFERFAQRILRESGFVKVNVTGRSGDGGIDGVGVLRINLLSFHVLFQCKRYQGSVGAGDIRNFRGAMIGRSDKGLFITTGTFTSDAQKEATRDGAPPIELIDGDFLCDIAKRLSLGVTVEMVEQVVVSPRVV